MRLRPVDPNELDDVVVENHGATLEKFLADANLMQWNPEEGGALQQRPSVGGAGGSGLGGAAGGLLRRLSSRASIDFDRSASNSRAASPTRGMRSSGGGGGLVSEPSWGRERDRGLAPTPSIPAPPPPDPVTPTRASHGGGSGGGVLMPSKSFTRDRHGGGAAGPGSNSSNSNGTHVMQQGHGSASGGGGGGPSSGHIMLPTQQQYPMQQHAFAAPGASSHVPPLQQRGAGVGDMAPGSPYSGGAHGAPMHTTAAPVTPPTRPLSGQRERSATRAAAAAAAYGMPRLAQPGSTVPSRAPAIGARGAAAKANASRWFAHAGSDSDDDDEDLQVSGSMPANA